MVTGVFPLSLAAFDLTCKVTLQKKKGTQGQLSFVVVRPNLLTQSQLSLQSKHS